MDETITVDFDGKTVHIAAPQGMTKAAAIQTAYSAILADLSKSVERQDYGRVSSLSCALWSVANELAEGRR